MKMNEICGLIWDIFEEIRISLDDTSIFYRHPDLFVIYFMEFSGSSELPVILNLCTQYALPVNLNNIPHL